MPRALITGAAGQDGSYLCEYLLNLGYEVHGLVRHTTHPNLENLQAVGDRVILHTGNIAHFDSLVRIFEEVKPQEIYSLAAQSFVGDSYVIPSETVAVNALGAFNVYEAARLVCPEARIYNAATSEIFGSSPPPQSEESPHHPESPYACAKLYAFHQAINYREAHGLFIANGICFNHTSERRPPCFVTRKVTQAAARIRLGLQRELALGNLDSGRDWGYAPDYVRAMHLLLQQETPEDFVIATGECHTVREVVEVAFGVCGLKWEDHVRIDHSFVRQRDPRLLQGDARKIRRKLGWQPAIAFQEMIGRMTEHDLRLLGGRT